jgi:isopentenyl-diphosphate delta-isomerase
MDFGRFEERKRDHIRHALDPANQASGRGGLDSITLEHEALPELDFREVRIDTRSLGAAVATPFYVAGMTAGHADAPTLNRVLAEACESRGWAMGVGSQRRELDDSRGSATDGWKELRKQFPKLVLFGNLGISQLIRTPLERVRALAEGLEGQAICIHVNALQEALQPEGTPEFRGALRALEAACKALPIPVILKETGCGFSPRTLERLRGTGLRAIDVSGLGGTHWGRIEGARAKEQPGGELLYRASVTFAEWGVPTLHSLQAALWAGIPACEIWASGGVRSGLDAAKLIHVGAERVGYAKPALEAALQGPEALARWMELQEYELKVALFCTGSGNVAELRGKGEGWRKNAN